MRKKNAADSSKSAAGPSKSTEMPHKSMGMFPAHPPTSLQEAARKAFASTAYRTAPAHSDKRRAASPPLQRKDMAATPYFAHRESLPTKDIADCYGGSTGQKTEKPAEQTFRATTPPKKRWGTEKFAQQDFRISQRSLPMSRRKYFFSKRICSAPAMDFAKASALSLP